MPSVTFTSYALLGAGKLATHLEFYLKSLNLPFQKWSRGQNDLNQILMQSSHVLLALSDSALPEMSERCAGTGRVIVHFSGALNLPLAQAAHPLMTFGPELQTLDWYKSIPFICDEGFALGQLLPGLSNRAFQLKPEKRALYHSLCSLAGNSAFLLWRQIGSRFEQELGLPREVLTPFLHQTVENAFQETAGAFTGPVARGDWGTVEKHLEALNSDTELFNTYKNYLNMATRSGVQLPEALK